MNEVMKALKDDNVTAVGIYGMGGVGKTSMVKHVGAHSRKIGIFHHVIMGVVSQSLDLIKIQGTLAELLGLTLMENTEIGRAARLKTEIMRREKILIILDDLWRGIELSRGIGNLTNLRMLDVSVSEKGLSTNPFKVISKLHRLEELYMLGCGFENWSSTDYRKIIVELAGLPNLKVLQVSIPNAKYIPKNVDVEPNLVNFAIYISGTPDWPFWGRDHTSRSLRLENTSIRTLPDWFVNAVARKTEKLEYLYCRGLTDILMEYDCRWLHGLKHLTVDGGSSDFSKNLKVLMNTTTRVQREPVFENLEELHVQCLDCLEELCVGELPAGSLINLKVLHAHTCPSLGNVSKLLQGLPNLEELYLTRMDKMEYVFGCEGFEPEQSKLRETRLQSLDSLKSICNSPAPRQCSGV